MTKFKKNPFAAARAAVNAQISKENLENTVEKKFKHKSFAERFGAVNKTFKGLSFVAQAASLVTAFIMLSFLFDSLPMILRVGIALVLVFAIEMLKRSSTEDMMQGIFQYQHIEYFPAALATLMVCTSIFISIKGAELMPNLTIADHINQVPTPTPDDAIRADFDNQITETKKMRDDWATSRKWKGRLSKVDAKKVEDYNQKIQLLEERKAAAIQQLNIANAALLNKAINDNEAAHQQVATEREKEGNEMVIIAIIFELTFLVSMGGSWWFYSEVKKEKHHLHPANSPSGSPNNSMGSPAFKLPIVKNQKLDEPFEQQRPIGFLYGKNSPNGSPNSPTASPNQKPPQSTIDKSRSPNRSANRGQKKGDIVICPSCQSYFEANSHNHTYCTAKCKQINRKHTSKI